MRALLALAIAAAALAGCASEDEAPALATLSAGRIEGVVTDVALAPLAGALVRVDGANASATTDAAGAFAIVVPPGEHLVIATKDGHRGATLRAAPGPGETARLSFALHEIPSVLPRVDVAEARGRVGCAAVLDALGEPRRLDCGAQDPNQRTRVAFAVESLDGLEGIVVEIAWEPTTQGAKRLDVQIFAGDGDSSQALARTVLDGSGAVAIPGRVLEGKLRQGASLVVEVGPAGSFTDEEAGGDAGAAVEQPFEAYASFFHHAPPPAGYSVRPAQG